ncbi:hypothetical protein [Candidatus Hodgkinia cicadicola]
MLTNDGRVNNKKLVQIVISMNVVETELNELNQYKIWKILSCCIGLV